jgi:peroxiredoxin
MGRKRQAQRRREQRAKTQRALDTPGQTEQRDRSADTRLSKKRSQGRSVQSNAYPLVGGIVTVLIIAGILGYVALKNATAPPQGPGLTDPNKLYPVANQIAVGKTAPNFTLKDINGHKYTLSKERGHPVLLEFFAVYCPICQAEAPTIAQIQKTYGPKGVVVWSILSNPYGRDYENSGGTDTRLANKGDMTWFAQHFNVHHPQLVDPNFHVVNEYGIQAYPGLYVIDPKGKVVFSKSGNYPYQTLADNLNTALQTAS